MPSSRFRDDIDRRLVALLRANARESATGLAKKLGLARSTVQERIARLERSGVIAGYAAVLGEDPGAESVEALVLLSVDQQRTRQIIERLGDYPEITLCLAINGAFDLFLSLEAPRLEDLDVILDELAEIPGVQRSETSIVLGRKFDRRADRVGG